LPISGPDQPALASIDETLATFVAEQRIPGAAFAVANRGRLVYARGFGLADRERERIVQPTDLFRIASVSKPITAVAVLQLVERGKLALNASVWEILKLSEPFDARWKQVTVRHLLHHTGGWDTEKTKVDPIFASLRIAKHLNVPLPVGPQHIIDYMLGQPLQFDPGSRFAYSNFGYCLLGQAIQRVTGIGYESYVQQEVLAPLGIRRMRLGKTLPPQRVDTEVKYYDDQNRTAPAVVGPIGEQVPLPYGAWWLEALDSTGGWLASAIDLVRFACAFDDPATCLILRAESIATMFARPEGEAGIEVGGNYPGCGWFVWPEDRHVHRAHTSSNGRIAGSSCYLMRRRDGINWAAVFNTSNESDGKPLILRIRDATPAAFDRVKHWPATDQFATLL
jgi:N-acyl-D-amino-acid deacylase